jgi:hypothetical protein
MRRPTVAITLDVDEARALLDVAGRGEPATYAERSSSPTSRRWSIAPAVRLGAGWWSRWP